MKKFLLLAVLLFSTVFVSGCIDFKGLFNGGEKYEDDVIIITNIVASPSIITTDQTTSLLTYIKNVGKRKIEDINVNLYDYGEGIFTVKLKSSCAKNKKIKTNDIVTGCNITLVPGETKIMEWTLTPTDIKLTTSVDVGVLVEYPFNTTGLSTVHFITEEEYERQIKEGIYLQKYYKPTLGEGPIKAYFKVQNQEPIPVSDNKVRVSLTLEIENTGAGYLLTNVRLKNFNLSSLSKTDDCAEEIGIDKEIKLIKGKRSLPCVVSGKDIKFKKELTKKLSVDISYTYALKKEVKITVNPSK